MIKNVLVISFLFVLLLGCRTGRDATLTTVSTSYQREANLIYPLFTVFHVNDSLSELHFRIRSKELLYTRKDGINFSSDVKISYVLLGSYNSKTILDSSSFRLIDENNGELEKELVGKINFKAKAPQTYFLRVQVIDLNRNIEVNHVLSVDKSNPLNRQNFHVQQADKTPVFQKYIKTGQEVAVRYRSKMSVDLFVRFYRRDFPLAPPPFSMVEPKPFVYRADSTYKVMLDSAGTYNFTSSKKGFYHFQLDTSRREGLTLFNYSDVFPEVKKADDLVPPLRYICSRDEYEKLANATNKKAAVEEFWLNSTGSAERAKEVIRKFYNRVQDANLFFTSYLEGWKTDRGMIYLIYGAPNTIYRTAEGENWIYGEENNINSVNFFFSKVNNPFTENDYALERSPSYKQSWFIAVDVWRLGRTYLQE